MSRSRALILFLLAGNFVLGALLLFTRQHPEKPAAANGKRSHYLPPASTSTKAPHVVEKVVTNDFRWAQLETEDYKEYIARLRSIGCPEETIKDIVIADLEKLMAPRVRALTAPREAPKFWKIQPKEFLPVLDSLEQLSKKDDIEDEKREIIRDLLGVDLVSQRYRQTGESDHFEERLGFLSEEKRGQIREIAEKANREEIYLREKSWLENDELTPEEKKRLRELQSNKEKAIAALLTPEEFEQYNLWYSPSAYKVRDAFVGLETSEQEFMGVYELQKSFDDKWAAVEPDDLSPAEQAEMEQDKAALQSNIQEFLGDERYQDYQRGGDAEYRELLRAAAQFHLSPGVAQEVYSFKPLVTAQRQEVRNNPALSPEQKERVLQAIGEETQRTMVEAMGPKAFRYYVRAGGGRWIFE